MSSSWSRLGLAVGGAVALNMIFPGASFLGMGMGAWGFLGGSILGSILFPTGSKSAKPYSARPNMPQADQYPTQSSAKDIPIPKVYGTTRIAGNVIWMGPAVPYQIAHETGVIGGGGDSGGGKGGFGGGGDSGGSSGGTVVSYETRYRRSFLIGVCEGVATIGRCWKNDKLISTNDFTQFDGDDNSGISTLIGKEFAEYKHLCCAYFEDYELGNTKALPNFVFEVNSEYYNIQSYLPDGDEIHVIHGTGVTMDSGVAVDHGAGAGGRLCGLPCKYHPYSAGQTIRIGGGSHPYDNGNGYLINEITDTEIIIVKPTFSSHTFSGVELIHRVEEHGAGNILTGHGCVVGGYLYCGRQAKSGDLKFITRINLETLQADTDWAQEPAGGWQSTVTFGAECVAGPDGEHVYLFTIDPEIVYKFRISDGVCVWEYDHPDGNSNNYGMDVDSAGRVYAGGFRDAFGDPGYYSSMVRLLADGSGVDKIYPGEADAGSKRLDPYCVSIKTDYTNAAGNAVQIFAACGGELSSGSTVYGYPLFIFRTDSTGYLIKEKFGNSCRVLQAIWNGDYLYLFGSGMYDGGNGGDGPYNVWKYQLNSSVDILGDVSYSLDLVTKVLVSDSPDSMWFGADGNLWIMRDSAYYTGDDKVVILDKDDLSVIGTKQFNQFTYSAGSNIIVSPEFRTNQDVTGVWHDEYPPNIIQDILTNQRYGGGFPLSWLNLTTFADALSYCVLHDIKISPKITDEQPLPDFIEYICSHFGGFICESQGKICLKVFKDEDAVADLTRDDLVSDGKSNPVKIKKRDYDQTYNRIEIAWTDRAKTYDANVEPANENIDQRESNTVRKNSIDLRAIHLPDLAAKMAWRYLFDSMYRFSMYSFMVGYKHMLLEVGDVITVTDGDELDSQKMRIMSISEDVNGRGLAIEAVEEVARMYPDIAYEAQQSERTDPASYDPQDGSVVFRESVDEAKLFLSITPSSAHANGWYIYRSFDGAGYDLIGRGSIGGVTGGAANSAGTLQTSLSAYAAVVHRQDESFLVNIGTVTDLADASDINFFNNHHLCKIGDEIIAYKTCVETETDGVWKVSNLIRGLFGTKPVAHTAGEAFATLDVTFTYPLTDSDIGKTLYFKVVTFYGDEIQSVSEVSVFTHKIQGLWSRPMSASLPRLVSDENDIPTLQYSGSSFTLYWNLPGKRGTGFNQGGFDLNSNYPEWRYGDALAELQGGDGSPYGNFLADSELQGIDLVFEQTDGTPIGSRSVAATANSATISKADDLGGLSTAVIKIFPRRSRRSSKAAQLQVTGV